MNRLDRNFKGLGIVAGLSIAGAEDLTVGIYEDEFRIIAIKDNEKNLMKNLYPELIDRNEIEHLFTTIVLK